MLGPGSKRRDSTGSGSRWRRVLASLVIATGAGGCALQPGQPAEPARRATRGEPPFVREQRLARDWTGRSRQELIDAWGTPRWVLRLPYQREPASLILVFVDQDPSGGCIDAFVVLQDDAETIWNYFCR